MRKMTRWLIAFQAKSIALITLTILSLMLLSTLPSVNLASAALPETPAGKQMAKLLASIESGNYKEYIQNNFSKEFLEKSSVERTSRFFQEIKSMHGSFSVHSIEESTETKIAVLLESQKMKNAWRRMDLITEQEAPYKIIGFGIDFARAPVGSDEAMKRGAEKGGVSGEEAKGELLNPKVVKGKTEKEILKQIEKDLEIMTAEDSFSGSVFIAREGKPIFKQAYGMASKEFQVPNRIDTKFNIGSINKSFTQMAIAQLLEKGLVKLEDTIGKHLDDFPKEIADKVTLKHLLDMSSGMGHYWNEEWLTKWAEIKTVQQLIDIIKKVPLDFEPGTQKQYSNSGYVVLGAIIEKVTGQSYYDYVREKIFKPLGMKNTDSYELDQIVPNLARGYTVNRSENPYNDNQLQNNLFIHSIKGSPAGGGYSTVEDLNIYAEALKANKLAGEKYINQILGLFLPADEPERKPKGFAIAGGAPVGINAMVRADFESGYTVIVLSNYDPPIAQEVSEKIMKMFLPSKAE